jgi:hypothetical protein
MRKDPLQQLLDTTRVTLAASVAAGTAAITTTTPFSIATLGAPVAVIIALRGIERVIPVLVARSRKIRRAVFGRAFVEGWWKDATYIPSADEVVYGSCSHWTYEDGQIEVSGQTFDPTGRFLGTYLLHSVGLPRKEMVYEFRWAYVDREAHRPSVNGYGSLTFVSNGGRPESYFGSFLDNHNGRTLPFRGWYVAEDGSSGAPSSIRDAQRLALSAMKLLQAELGNQGVPPQDSPAEPPDAPWEEGAAGIVLNR